MKLILPLLRVFLLLVKTARRADWHWSASPDAVTFAGVLGGVEHENSRP